ncbi:TOMM precursor leader peptide-binding protein [Paenibacillaceae bacterium WGS1546]|uniref:TOMM precursor leader peptide-binding protein n=1 Tax=Cohnella sp. WGS1546 TaxID=3366810 RepID=UPI00372D12F0
MRDFLAVIGDGQLAETVIERLSAHYPVVRTKASNRSDLEGARLALVLADRWRPEDDDNTERCLRDVGLPWLKGCLSRREAVVGPLTEPGKSGCFRCGESRRATAENERPDRLADQLELLMQGGVAADPAITRIGYAHTGSVIAAEAGNYMSGRPMRTESALLIIELHSLRSSRHIVVPDPLCPYCGRLPEDSAAGANAPLRPNPKPDPQDYRLRSPDGFGQRLIRDCLDERTGLFTRIETDSRAPFAAAYAGVPSAFGLEYAAGRTHRYSRSAHAALLEGLERYCGMLPRARRTVVRDSYRNLSNEALHPADTGLYAPEQYALPGFPFAPFDPDAAIRWVWGYSFARRRPILVPEQLAYYSAGSDEAFVMEGSNGCALGASREEAVLHGILEAVERDSCLIAWHARLALPALDPLSSRDKELRWMIDYLECAYGYEIRLYDATTDIGIPSIWAMAKSGSGQGPNLVCAGAAHPDPVKAAKSAIHEIAGNIVYLGERIARDRRAIRRMLRDPRFVSRMEDHALLYGLPEAESRLDFLRRSDRPAVSFEDAFAPVEPHRNLTQDLIGLLRRILVSGLDVIAIDQTAPEASRLGLHCAKALIPGLVPMSYGYRLERLSGLRRVVDVPRRLGYSPEPLLPERLNVDPHPFL